MEKSPITVDLRPGLDVARFPFAGFEKFMLTAHPDEDGESLRALRSIVDYATEEGLKIISQDVFGSRTIYEDGISLLKHISSPDARWPVSWIEGNGFPHGRLSGSQALALKGTSVAPIEVGGRLVGYSFEDEDAEYCFLTDIRPSDTERARGEQTTSVYDRVADALAGLGMDFTNVIRTWVYIDDILDWYDEFNAARTAFYQKYHVFENMVPASTGIGVGNPHNSALILEAFAVKPKHEGLVIKEVKSPLQSSAEDYGSSFSRAVELDTSKSRILFVSGTASISRDGDTLHPESFEDQLDLSMRVVEAILESRGMGWNRVVRGNAYCKHNKDFPLFGKYCEDQGIKPMPIALAHADICRDDLLFEIELEAVEER